MLGSLFITRSLITFSLYYTLIFCRDKTVLFFTVPGKKKYLLFCLFLPDRLQSNEKHVSIVTLFASTLHVYKFLLRIIFIISWFYFQENKPLFPTLYKSPFKTL